MSFVETVLLAQLVVTPLTFWLFLATQRKKSDVTIGDVVAMAFVSLLPFFSAMVAFAIIAENAKAPRWLDNVAFKRKVK